MANDKRTSPPTPRQPAKGGAAGKRQGHAAEGAKIWIIAMVTYLMALGSFTHIVVGSAEVGYLAFAGEIGWTEFLLKFALPTLGGNIVGGSLIFALISHAQIRSEG